jgi:lipopolysaccharide transport system ATP-binding protein
MSSEDKVSLEAKAQHMSGRTQVVIRTKNLSKCYEIYDKPQDRLKQGLWRGRKKFFREFWALKDVSFEVEKGETMGVIGRNGSGKSTLLQLICGTLTPTSGDVEVNGRVAALLELGAGFNPEFTGRENVHMNAAILGITKEQVNEKFQEIADFAEIGEFMDQPVKTYSSGMFVRLAFAVQVCVEPDILVVDEALAVGDIFFRQKCYARLEQLRKSGVAVLLVSHSMPDIEQYCERAIVLDRGTVRFVGPATQAAKHYYLLHQTGRGKALSQSHSSVARQRDIPVGGAIDSPAAEAFLDLSGRSQVSNGQARCTGVALCNASGEPCNVFRQGDMAIFYYEFELSEDIGVPICGLVIRNDRGVIVHGKNSWQFDDDVPESLGPHTKVLCQQRLKLDLGAGEYAFEIGLASISAIEWKNRERISHEIMSSSCIRVCHIADAGTFSIGLAVKNGVSVLTHHGIADLPGELKIAVHAVEVFHV